MDFYNKLKSFLGIPPLDNNNRIDVPVDRDDFDSRPLDEYEKFGFNVFSNPLEMHKYFEQQMNEMMKSFGVFNNDAPFFGNDESFFGGFKESSPFGFSQFPEEGDLYETMPDKNLRDKFLKPGYENPSDKDIKTDSDLDAQYKSGDFNHAVIPKSRLPSQNFSFGSTTMSKTIKNSDGFVEIHKSVENQNGVREETVTRKLGDKEYTIVTRTDKNGVKEIKENFVNIDESEKDTFFNKNKNVPSLKPTTTQHGTDESLFNKFFRY